MGPKPLSIVSGLLVGVLLVTALACDRIRMPSFGFGEEPVHRLPQTVKLSFDESLRNATIEHVACGNIHTWEGHLGHAVANAFLKTSRKGFDQVTVEGPDGAPQTAGVGPADLTIHTSLLRKSFKAIDRMSGYENRYHAKVDVELGATYLNASGQAIAEAPLLYTKTIGVWTPVLGTGGTRCVTGQLDAALEKAADDLARQMLTTAQSVVSQRSARTAAARTPAPVPVPPPAGLTQGSALVSMKATLLDANDNQILEAGERVGVRLDVTNTSQTQVASTSIVLAGSPAILDAFAHSMASLVRIGPLQPGETKGTVFWGRMPATVESQRGELSVSVVPAVSDQAGGLTQGGATSQTLVAAIRPGPAGSQQRMATQPEGRSAAEGQPSVRVDPSNHYAVIVGLNQYRDQWPRTAPPGSAAFNSIPTVLRKSVGVPDDHILVMKDDRATRTDVEAGIYSWLPQRVGKNSIVFFYFVGQAAADPQTGEVFLIPYEGEPASSTRRLVSLEELQRALAKLNTKLSVLLVDAHVSTKGPKTKKPKPPNWRGTLEPAGRGRRVPVIQIVRSGKHAQTASLLDGLNGKTDANRDGVLTVGELLRSVRDQATVQPTILRSDPVNAITLAANPVGSSNTRRSGSR